MMDENGKGWPSWSQMDAVGKFATFAFCMFIFLLVTSIFGL